jgi:septum formation protein
MAETGRSRLILASGSPFRRNMLEAAGLEFEVVPPDVDEAGLKRELMGCGGAAVAAELAAAKALAVSRARPEALVIGADQVLDVEGALLDKSGDMAAARAQLMRLRGRTHRLLTAVALAQGGQIVWRHAAIATLTMRAFSEEFLDDYLARAGDGLCRIVGAYEVEGLGIQLLERVEGDHFTIVGLPLLPLLHELRSRGMVPA